MLKALRLGVEGGRRAGRLWEGGVLRPQRLLSGSAAVGAGHAHWQNVAKDKAKGDSAKATISNRAIKAIEKVAKGGLDPDSNRSLAAIIKEAHAAGVSAETIKKTLKRLASKTTVYLNVPVIGPGGAISVVQFLSDDTEVKCKRNVTKVIKRTDPKAFSIGSDSALAHFEEKGIIESLRGLRAETNAKAGDFVDEDEVILGQQLSLEEMQDIAIEVEAEDVSESVDEEGRPAFEFLTEPLQVGRVEERLRQAKVAVLSAEVGFLPFARVSVSPDERQLTAQLFADLMDIDDVKKIYTNIKAPEEHQ